MGKKRKLLKKILSGPRTIRFDEFTSLVEAFGFELKRIRGSHCIYKHPKVAALLSVQSDANNHAKSYQVRQFLKLVEEYELTLQEAETDEENDE